MTAAFGTNPALANFEAMAKSNMDFFENAMRMFAPFAAPRAADAPEAPDAPPAPPVARTQSDLASLKEQLEAMQARLDAMAKTQND